MERLARTKNIQVNIRSFSAPTHILPTESNNSGPRKSTLCIMACHSTNPIKIKLIINNLHYLSKIADAFVLIDSTECQSNNLQNAVKEAHPSLRIDL